MRWSKLKSLTEERFAAKLGSRVAIFSTRYGDCTCGRAWITIDDEVVASFCTRAAENVKREGQSYPEALPGHGELSRQDAYASCWAFVHDLSVDDALADTDPLVQSLSVLDRRVGKGRLGKIDWQGMHPLAQSVLRVRLAAEGLRIPEGLGGETPSAHS